MQKTALHIMLGGLYSSYGDALKLVGLDTLKNYPDDHPAIDGLPRSVDILLDFYPVG